MPNRAYATDVAIQICRIGTVFRTVTETSVFDQNRIKPKPQYFVVRDTVFTGF